MIGPANSVVVESDGSHKADCARFKPQTWQLEQDECVCMPKIQRGELRWNCRASIPFGGYFLTFPLLVALSNKYMYPVTNLERERETDITGQLGVEKGK